MLVSFVIPAYNAEVSIRRCVSSCCHQGESELEVIVIDDGSTDGTAGIVEAMAVEDGRIRLVRQANGGPGAARNAGIDASSGDYLCFVDADDFVSPFYAETVRAAVEEDGGLPGIVYFRFARCWDPDRRFERPIDVGTRLPLEELFALCLFPFPHDGHYWAMPDASWAKAYSRALLDESGVRFPADVRRTEDVIFNILLLLHERGSGVRSFPYVDTVMYCIAPSWASSKFAYCVDGMPAMCEKGAAAFWDVVQGCFGQCGDWDNRIYSRLFDYIQIVYWLKIARDRTLDYPGKREMFLSFCSFYPVSLCVSDWRPSGMGAQARVLHWCARHGVFMPTLLLWLPFKVDLFMQGGIFYLKHPTRIPMRLMRVFRG